MIELGLLFGKIIPFDTLAQLPLHFVHRLRDLRIKQVEEANRAQSNQMNSIKNNAPLIPNGAALDPAMFNGTPLDDIVDELT